MVGRSSGGMQGREIDNDKRRGIRQIREGPAHRAGGSCTGEAADRGDDRTNFVVMPGTRRGIAVVIVVVVVAGNQRQQAVDDLATGGAGFGMAMRGDRGGEVESEMDRYQRVEAQRDHTEPGSEGCALWPIRSLQVAPLWASTAVRTVRA
jgi:hypothetical protein